MSNFQKYIATEQRTYPSVDLTAVPGYVYDFGTLPVPADGRWQSNAGPATGVFDNTIVPGSPGSGGVSPTNQVWVYPGVFVDSSTLPLGTGTFAPLLTPPTTVTYNGDGTVATQTIGGVATTYTYNGDGTVATETRAGVTRTYSYTSGNLTSVA